MFSRCKSACCPEHRCCQSSLHKMVESGLLINTKWFMQNGVTPCIAYIILDFLHDSFGSSVAFGQYPDSLHMGGSGSHSMDINPCYVSLRIHKTKTAGT
jgi:hypothetical protein